jgi:cyclopropane-fatty-acyl-phospholipid synthase
MVSGLADVGPARRPRREVAAVLGPFLSALLGSDLPFAIRFWDGSQIGAYEGSPPPATVVVRSPRALRRILYGPDELGFGRAFVTGELDIEGDLLWLLTKAELPALHEAWARPATWIAGLRMATELRILGKPLPAPPEEYRLPGPLRSRLSDAKRHDERSVSHHYDVGNEFYRLVLGPTMAYSCARFVNPHDDLEAAQEAKHDLICRKLGLQPGMRLLDVGCGWGGMARHAARHYGVRAVGITLAAEQQRWAVRATEEAGLAGLVEIRRQDFRDLDFRGSSAESFDAVCSIGMFEHVSSAAVQTYFSILYGLLRPGGRILNHAISQPQGTDYGHRSFLLRYVFPNGELRDVGSTVEAMQRAGFEARDVESLREHYALTLRRWLANLESHWEQAEALVGAPRARIWRLYMSGSVNSFEKAEVGVHQVLGVKLRPGGASGFPLTRAAWG